MLIDGETAVRMPVNTSGRVAVAAGAEAAGCAGEHGLELAGSPAVEYYGRALDEDWRGGGGALPTGIVLGVAVAAGVALGVPRLDIQFGG